MSQPMLTFVALMLTGCPGGYADPMAAESDNPECGTDALAKLTAAKAIDLNRVCGKTPVKDCAQILKQPVDDKYRPLFDKWEKCPP